MRNISFVGHDGVRSISVIALAGQIPTQPAISISIQVNAGPNLIRAWQWAVGGPRPH